MVGFLFNRYLMQVAFFFFLIKKRNKKNQGRKDYIPFCQAAMFNGCATVTSAFALYSLIRCLFLCNASIFLSDV